MSNIVYFLSVEELKERSSLDNNIEDKQLENSITDAQEIDLQSVIGTRLLNKLKTEVVAGTTSGTYKTLMDDYIFYFLLKFAERRALLFMWVKFRNKGLMQQNSDNSQPVDIATFDKIRSELLNDCEFYSNRLKAYLIEEQDNLVEYRDWNADNNSSNMAPNQNDSYFSGIHLESNRYCKGSSELDYIQSTNNNYLA